MNRLSTNRLFRNLISAAFSSVTLLTLFIPVASSQVQDSYHALVAAPLTLDRKTVLPGKTLGPGTYTIQIVDLLKDRFIIQVDDSKGGTLATFIGLHNPEFDPLVASKQRGPVFWSAAPKGTEALRAFSFPNGNTLEFVYPKDQAVALAKLNTFSVPAIDPESEGRKPDPSLSPEDRKIVTLWMLTATRVGPKNETPAIEAKRFVSTGTAAPDAAPIETTDATPPPAPPPNQVHPAQVRPAPVQVAKADPSEAPRIHAAVKRLPQTASDLPLVLLLSLLLLSGAGGLRVARNRA